MGHPSSWMGGARLRGRVTQGGGWATRFWGWITGFRGWSTGGAAESARGISDKDEGVGAGGGVGVQVEAEGAAGGSLGEAGDEGALLGRDVGAVGDEQAFDLVEGKAPSRTEAQRERMVGSSSPGFSARMRMWVVSGGSSRTLSRELAASFIMLVEVRMKMRRGASAGR